MNHTTRAASMLRSSTRRLVFYSASSSPCAVSPLLALPRALEPLHPWHNRVQPARYFSSSRCVGGQVEDFKLADIGEGITECEIVKWSVSLSHRPCRVHAFKTRSLSGEIGRVPVVRLEADSRRSFATVPFGQARQAGRRDQ